MARNRPDIYHIQRSFWWGTDGIETLDAWAARRNRENKAVKVRVSAPHASGKHITVMFDFAIYRHVFDVDPDMGVSDMTGECRVQCESWRGVQQALTHRFKRACEMVSNTPLARQRAGVS